MFFLLPVALGSFALTTLGLGLKRALEQLSSEPSFPVGSAGWRAWALHQEALLGLRASRQRVRERAWAYSERQGRALQETLVPFRVLLERLERWEHARADEVLTPGGAVALGALPLEPVPHAVRWAWTLLGVGAVAPPPLERVLEWLDKGWLKEGAPPVVVNGVSLYPAVACNPSGTDELEAVRLFESARLELGRAMAFLDAVHVRLEALDAQVATLQGRASAQLEYLDAESFEQGRPEPRERLLRLGTFAGALAEALCVPVLTAEGRLAPLSAPLEP